MPDRFSNSAACHSIAAINPISSSRLGRRSEAILLTSFTVSSIIFFRSFILFQESINLIRMAQRSWTQLKEFFLAIAIGYAGSIIYIDNSPVLHGAHPHWHGIALKQELVFLF